MPLSVPLCSIVMFHRPDWCNLYVLMPTYAVSFPSETASEATAARQTDRDVQRATLRDLASLATDCAATESEIERRYAREVEDEKTKYERLKSDIAHRFTSLREEAQRTL